MFSIVITMPPHRKRMRRFENNSLRFLTFSCRRRLPLLGTPALRDFFLEELARTKATCGLKTVAWVVMPEHVHLLVWPSDPNWPIDRVMISLKGPMGRAVIAKWRRLGAPILNKLNGPDGVRYWQPGGGYDRNITSDNERLEKISYIHENPVRRGLVRNAVDWAWSSARWYAGHGYGPVAPDRM